MVLACAKAFDRIGMPEGQFHLTEAALYLATAPKSNSALGFFDALASVEAEAAEVPGHLKDASRDAKGFGHGEGYLYPHSYRDHWVAQQYLPDSLRGRVFYQPGALGLEGTRRGAVLERREAQLALVFDSGREESFAWSDEGEEKREWRARAESSAPARLALVRTTLYDLAAPSRGDRVLVLDAREGYLVWEALRRCPEGTIAAAARNAEEATLIAHYAATLPELERPLVAALPISNLKSRALESAFGFSRFDHAVGRDLLASSDLHGSGETVLGILARALPGTTLTMAQVLPREGARLSELFAERLGPELASRLRDFEEGFYSRQDISSLGPGRQALEAALEATGFDSSCSQEGKLSPHALEPRTRVLAILGIALRSGARRELFRGRRFPDHVCDFDRSLRRLAPLGPLRQVAPSLLTLPAAPGHATEAWRSASRTRTSYTPSSSVSSTSRKGQKTVFKLDRMRALCATLGEPQTAYHSIHVAGSKGKGSVSIMLARVLQASGGVVGLYTSPHLLRWKERISLAGDEMPEDASSPQPPKSCRSSKERSPPIFRAASCRPTSSSRP